MLNILFLTHFDSLGSKNLRNYIISKTNSHIDYMNFGLMIEHKKRVYKKITFISSDGKVISKTISSRLLLRHPISDLYQFFAQLYAFWLLLKFVKGKKYDICIAESIVLGVLALTLKKIGKCKMTIFHLMDIYGDYPVSRLVNNFFLFIQKILRKISYMNDYVWYLHSKLKKWDNDRGFTTSKFFIAADSFDQKEAIRYSKIKRNTYELCYIGSMNKYSGLDISIKSLKFLKERIPNIRLNIIGGYYKKEVLYYRNFAKKEGVTDNIKFFGFIPDKRKVKKIISQSVLGMAVYSPDEENGVLYTVPGKVIEYLQVGTPVVITKDGPQMKNDIRRYQAGILVRYDSHDVARNVAQILLDKEKYNRLQKGVLQLTKKLSHENVQSRIYRKILKLYNNSYNAKI